MTSFNSPLYQHIAKSDYLNKFIKELSQSKTMSGVRNHFSVNSIKISDLNVLVFRVNKKGPRTLYGLYSLNGIAAKLANLVNEPSDLADFQLVPKPANRVIEIYSNVFEFAYVCSVPELKEQFNDVKTFIELSLENGKKCADTWIKSYKLNQIEPDFTFGPNCLDNINNINNINNLK